MITTTGGGVILGVSVEDNLTFGPSSQLGFVAHHTFRIKITWPNDSTPKVFATLPESACYWADSHAVFVWDVWGNLTHFYFDNADDRNTLLAECEANLPRKER